MAKQLTTQNATITTAAVEVKTLTISGKQVTQAVFKQMEVENIIQPLDAELAGEPWGRVNYHPDKCADEREHLHVVWNKEGELRRATVYEPTVAGHKHLQAGLYVEALIAEGLDSSDPRTKANADRSNRVQVTRGSKDGDPGVARFTHQGVAFQGPVRASFLSVFRNVYFRKDMEEGLWHELKNVAGPEATSASIADRLPALNYTTSWRHLKELPQLFIAV
ncbi:hypothetical protein ACIBQ3_32370 [Streptomyces rubiginosohelvolus]|uniref:hypothetical protein n=1 Tax=Streptomyces rubiginosohelvolus TaxID=67362 RepID=UPI003796AC95